MVNECPHCHSSKVTVLHHGRKICGSVGVAAGAISGVTAVISGARLGATVGVMAGPTGTLLGGISGAVLGGLAGAVAGGQAGAILGDRLDGNLLESHQCLECSHCFNLDGG